MSLTSDLSIELQEALVAADIAVDIALSSGDEEALEDAKELVMDCLALSREYADLVLSI